MNLRVRPALKAKLEKLGKKDRRTLSAYVEKLLEDHVKSAFQVGVEHQKQAKQRSLFR
jgi:mRNA-degrading endonuclease RelE of RelBE toxin-antitoxin system